MKTTSKFPGLFWSLALAAVLLVCVTYSNHFNNPFEFDDSHTIVNNMAIRSIGNVPHFFVDAATTSSLPANAAYRPFLTTLNAIDCWWGGAGIPVPKYYHISIFTCFLVLGVLLFLFFKQIFDMSRPSALNSYFALLGATFFCVHAANAETINYVIARSDSFSTLMLVAAFLLATRGGKWMYWSLVPLVIGLLTKEPVIVFPVLILFYFAFFKLQMDLEGVMKGKFFAQLKGENMGKLFWPIAVVCLFYLGFSRHMTPPNWSSGSNEASLYLATQTFVYLHYLANFILPLNLSADTDWELVKSWGDDRVIIGLMALIVAATAVWRLSADLKTRPIAFGILWFYVALLPTSSIVPLAEVLNDHRVFFPYIGLVMAAVWTFSLFIESTMLKKNAGYQLKLFGVGAFALFALLGNAYGAHQRNETWSSAETLWKDVTEKSPRNARGLMNYGIALMAKADWVGADQCFDKAMQLWPNYSYLYINKAILKGATGKVAESEQLFNRALALNPANPEVYYFFGKFLKDRGRIDEAVIMLQRGLEVSKGHAGCIQLLAECKTLGENKNKQMTYDDCMNQSLAYYNVGNYSKCIEFAERALQFDAKVVAPYNNICAGYNGLKQWEKAIEYGEKGLKINPDFQLLKNNIAIAKKHLGTK